MRNTLVVLSAFALGVATPGVTRPMLTSTDAPSIVLVSPVSMWATSIDAGGMTSADASTITNPDSSITASTRHIVTRGNAGGRYLQARLVYDASAGGTITNPVIKVFARRQAGDAWQIMPNVNGSISVTLTLDTTNDVSDGTYKRTMISPTLTTWDLCGCNQFLIGVETAVAHSTGTASLAYLETRIGG